MDRFNFITGEQALRVSIRGKSYPVTQVGKGMPCLFICLGTPSLRTISAKFTEMFTVYSSDVYWIDDHALDNPDTLTIDDIVDDIKALADGLSLQNYILFGHSAYGIIALEFAKKYPGAAAGIIMIGTPVNSNAQVGEQNNAIFQREADHQRKSIDAERRAIVASEDLDNVTVSARWLREYAYRDAPRYWYIPDFDCSELWQGIVLNKLLIRLFTDILPQIDVRNRLETINDPILLAAGIADYDCCPWLWQELPNLPKNFTFTRFTKSGHWPHYEEPELFDAAVQQWLTKLTRTNEVSTMSR